TIQFSETQHNLIAYDLKTYEDGTILIHLDLNNENCTQPILYFRLYFTNGTLINLDIDVTNEIPGFNFCKIYSEGVYQYYLDVYPLVEQYIFVAYLNSSEVPNASVYGLLIDWKGSIWSNNYLNVATVSRDGLVQPPGPIYYSKYLKKNGFLYVGYKSNTNDIIWNNGIIEDVNNNSNDNSIEEINFSGYPLAGGGFCLVTTRSIINLNTNKPLRKRQRPKGPPPPPPQQPQQVFTNECLNDIEIDPTKVNFRIDANFLAIPETSNLRNSESNLIFHSPLQDLHVLYIKCNVDYSLGDNLCQLFLIKGANKSKPYNLKISFTSSGMIQLDKEFGITARTSQNEGFNRIKLVYTSKLIDYSVSYQTRHAEGVIEMFSDFHDGQKDAILSFVQNHDTLVLKQTGGDIKIPCCSLYASTAQPVNYNFQQKVFRVDQQSLVFSEGPEVLNHVRYFSKYCKQILVNYFSWQGDPMPEEVIDAIIKVKQQQVNRNDVVDVFR
ncbi:18787_t:CDS:2, partial [Entrophospora sp. SA101]